MGKIKNYLFFRTDRIGDFLMSAILIKAIKRNDEQSHISVVASEKNYFYIRTLDFIDEVYLYPSNFIKKIFFFLNLNRKNYESICALDGKKRSIYFSIFLKSKYKFLMTTKLIFKKLLNSFFSKIFVFQQSKNKLFEILNVLELLKMTFKEEDIYYLKDQNIKSKNIKKISDYLIFHFDEKWIFNDYIIKYQSIEPTKSELDFFINELSKKTNKNIIITTGIKINDLLKDFMNSSKKVSVNLYEKKYNEKTIQLYTNINFFDLKYLIKDCSYIITCHGAATHIASAFNKKIYDIFDSSQKLFYSKWNSHMKNYNFFYRENFKNLTQKILLKI